MSECLGSIYMYIRLSLNYHDIVYCAQTMHCTRTHTQCTHTQRTHLCASGVHILNGQIIRWIVDSDPSSVSVVVIARYSSYNVYTYKTRT